MIILIIGEYGVGKDTFANMLLTHFGIDIAQIVRSHTTREPRYPDEITHTFKTIEDYKSDKENGCIVAETEINKEYYWSTQNQFQKFKNGFSIYVVDLVGLQQVIESGIDDIYLIEVVRPSWLIDVDNERKNREYKDIDYKYIVNYRVINDKTFEYLDSIARDVAKLLKAQREDKIKNEI